MIRVKDMLYSSNMGSDHLSEVLDLIAVRGVVSGGVIVDGAWQAEAAVAEELKFCAIVRGEAWLTTDGIEEPVLLREGEMAVLNARSWLSLQSGPAHAALAAGPGGSAGNPVTDVPQPENGVIAPLGGADPETADAFIGGRIDLDSAGRDLLLNALPPVAHVHAGMPAARRIRGHIDRLFDEITEELPGADFAVREYSQLLILDVLRAFAAGLDVPPGWLNLLGDERLRPALDLIHQHPETAWGLDDLSGAAAMSRTSFAVRFRDVAGMPPLTYLIRWRMLLAKRELRSADSRMRQLASSLGYSSESSFSSAFKRNVGEPPHSYRSRVRSEEESNAVSRRVTGAPSPL